MVSEGRTKFASREELAWCAGLFDGEGCITFVKGCSGVRLQLKMTDKKTVQRFGDLLGYNWNLEVANMSSRPAHWKQCYGWVIGRREDVVDCLSRLYPHLVTRQDKAKKALERLHEADAAAKVRKIKSELHMKEWIGRL